MIDFITFSFIIANIISVLLQLSTALDYKIVEASLTPLSQRQQSAKVWMRHFFKTYGDQSPNSEETLLQLMQRKDVYDLYKSQNEMKCDVIDFSRFNTLWHTIFPLCRIR
jgi:hypothetical protein